jgi:hypothetical protein
MKNIVTVGFVALAFSLFFNICTWQENMSPLKRFRYGQPVKVRSGFHAGCEGFIESADPEDKSASTWGTVKIVEAQCRPTPYKGVVTYYYILLPASDLAPVYEPAGLGR